MENEKWVKLIGFGYGYEISSMGRIKSFKRYPEGIIMKQSKTTPGYLHVGLFENGKGCSKTVHRLVAKHFIPNKYCLEQVNHKNGIKTDNRVENLEWCSRSENQRHSFETGLNVASFGEDRSFSKLTDRDVISIRERHIKGCKELGAVGLANKYGVSETTVRKIISKETWRHLL